MELCTEQGYLRGDRTASAVFTVGWSGGAQALWDRNACDLLRFLMFGERNSMVGGCDAIMNSKPSYPTFDKFEGL